MIFHYKSTYRLEAQHGGLKYFVIFIVPWTNLSDQNFFKILWMH